MRIELPLRLACMVCLGVVQLLGWHGGYLIVMLGNPLGGLRGRCVTQDVEPKNPDPSRRDF